MFNKTKIRFQNPNFRRKLKTARGYKRSIKKIPSSKLGIFLAFLHLDGLFAKITIFFVLLATVYILFAPNFLTIKHIEILGANKAAKVEIENSIKNFFSSKPFWPQGNLLLLSKNDLSQYLISKSQQTSKVLKIDKDFPSKLIIEIEERFDKFLLKNSQSRYVISNDGLITKQLNLEGLSAATTSSALIDINLKEEKKFLEKQRASDVSYFENLNQILNKAQSELQNPIAEIELESFEHPDFEARTQSGFFIKFDVNSDLQKTFWQLKLLLKEVGEARINGVKYIDMRIKDRGYVCYKDAKCAEANPISTASSTAVHESSITK